MKISNDDLVELIRRWKRMSEANVDTQRLVGPATLDTAIPLLEELLELRKEIALVDEAVFDGGEWADDIQHYIDCHEEDLPLVAKRMTEIFKRIQEAGRARIDRMIDEVEEQR